MFPMSFYILLCHMVHLLFTITHYISGVMENPRNTEFLRFANSLWYSLDYLLEN